MWVPSLIAAYPADQALPTGLIFACFMLAMTFGGMLFNLLLPMFTSDCEIKSPTYAHPGEANAHTRNLGVYYVNVIVFFCSAGSMLIPLFWFEFWPIFISFLILETMLGTFFTIVWNVLNLVTRFLQVCSIL
jgi:hypothetical protein